MNNTYKLAIGILLSLIGLYYAFSGLDFDSLWINLQRINIFYILTVFLLFIYSVYIRSKRWQILLRPSINISCKPLFSATIIGYFGNSVLPFRLGELLRGYSLSKDCTLKVSTIMGTIVLDRILDITGLFLVSVFFVFVFPLEDWLKTGLIAMAIVITIALAIVIIITKKKMNWEKYTNNILSQTKGSLKKILNFIINILNGFVQLGNTKNIGIIFFYTMYLWLIYFFCLYIVVIALNVDLSWMQAGLLLIATTLSISVPAAPGYIGTYHAVVIYMMVSVFGQETEISQSLAIVLHAVGFIPFVIVGAWFFAKSSVRLADIKNES